ncbi:hypothetical protein CU097_000517, partial [Rhizopus azygosporus]
ERRPSKGNTVHLGIRLLLQHTTARESSPRKDDASTYQAIALRVEKVDLRKNGTSRERRPSKGNTVHLGIRQL